MGAAPQQEESFRAASGESGHLGGRRLWQLAIDTGGTFTDCVATDPRGRRRRLKVLSSGRLRARVVRVDSPRAAQLDLGHELTPDFLVGYRLRWPARGALSRTVPNDSGAVEAKAVDTDADLIVGHDGRAGRGATVLRSTPTGRVELDRDWLVAADSERTCEIDCGDSAPVLCARLLTGTALDAALPAMELRLATTRGTNALLERQGAATVLFVNRGFADLLKIGTQDRPELFARRIEKPAPFCGHVIEVPGRLDRDGNEIEALEIDQALEQARLLIGDGVRSAAIALLHSYRNGAHEERLGEALRAAGFEHVSISSRLAPLIKIVPRAQTTVVDAYLGPVISDYLDGIGESLEGDRIWVMTSAGGLVRRRDYRASDSLLSGPAGGVVGAMTAGRAAGFAQILSFDMGGTSTDVARSGGHYEYVYEHRVGDASIVAPALYIETVAAGGGSICRIHRGQPRVGPESAGAVPGPACYGAGGPLTLTDVNLLLGRLDPERFEIPLDAGEAAEAAARELGRAESLDLDALLAGFLSIANERMADAMRRVSVQQGYDPTEHVLVAFGGAGAQHACAIATLLGIGRIVVPRDSSLLSAHGLRIATIERFAHRQILTELKTLASSGGLLSALQELDAEALALLRGEGAPAHDSTIRRRIVRLRLLGQESAFDMDAENVSGSSEREIESSLESSFHEQYQATFGYRPERPIEVESLRVVASTTSVEHQVGVAATPRAETDEQALGSAPDIDALVSKPSTRKASDISMRRRQAYFDGGRVSVDEIERRSLPMHGVPVKGPCLVVERHSTTVVEPGWQVRVVASGALVLEH